MLRQRGINGINGINVLHWLDWAGECKLMGIRSNYICPSDCVGVSISWVIWTQHRCCLSQLRPHRESHRGLSLVSHVLVSNQSTPLSSHSDLMMFSSPPPPHPPHPLRLALNQQTFSEQAFQANHRHFPGDISYQILLIHVSFLQNCATFNFYGVFST